MTDVAPSSPAAPGTSHSLSQRPRNPRGQGDRLREELIAAAQDLLAEAAHPDDVSIRAVARRAGVSPTAAYRHFSDRDDLVMTAIHSCFDEFTEELAVAVADVDNPFDKLRAAGRAYFAFAQAGHGHYRVLFSNPMPFEMEHDLGHDQTGSDGAAAGAEMAGSTAFEALIGLVQACLDAGAQTRTDDATYLSFQIWTWVHGIVDLRITHPGMDWPPAERLLDDLSVALGLVPPD